jgi:hypothetical protein
VCKIVVEHAVLTSAVVDPQGDGPELAHAIQSTTSTPLPLQQAQRHLQGCLRALQNADSRGFCISALKTR